MTDDPTAAPLPELPGVDVEVITQAMRADGVDLSDQAAVRGWLAGSATDLSAALGVNDAVNNNDGDDDADDDGDGDGDDEDYPDDDEVSVKELFGLPDRLPPLRLPSDAELAAAARECRLLARTRTLADWVADRTVAVDEGSPSGADCAALAQLLGIDVDVAGAGGNVTGLDDLPELAHLWDLAESVELIELDEKEATRGAALAVWPDGGDEDVLDVWGTALAVVMTSLDLDVDLYGEQDLDFYGAGGALLMALFLSRGGGAPYAELSEMIRESCSPAVTGKGWAPWVAEHGDPARVLLGRFDELGAVVLGEDSARLTPLAQWAMWSQLTNDDVDVPLLPPVEEMTAAELISAAEGFTEEELAEETTAWLGLRTPDAAARELLDAAAAGEPADRMYATSMVTSRLGADAEPHWRSALTDQRLAPYAKLAIGLEPESADLAWLLTDVLAATSELDGPEDIARQLGDAVPAGRELEIFELMWRLPHPAAGDVLTLLGAHHPNREIAKAARKAAFKAASRND